MPAKKARSKPAAPSLPLDLANRLYDAGVALAALEPWEEVDETQIFQVAVPGRPEPVTVSVMGRGGEHRALSLYLDADATGRFLAMHGPLRDEEPSSGTMNDELALLLEGNTLQVAFESVRHVRPEQKELAKEAGRDFRRRLQPCFLSFTGGFAARMVDEAEARCLAEVMEQAIVVLDDVESVNIPSCLDKPAVLPQRVLIGEEWETRWVPWHGKLHQFDEWPADPALAEALRPLPAELGSVEFDFHRVMQEFPHPSGKSGWPILGLMISNRTGAIIGFDLVEMQETMEATLEACRRQLLNKLVSLGAKPAEVITAGRRAHSVVAATFRAAGVMCHPGRTLACEQALESMRMAGLV